MSEIGRIVIIRLTIRLLRSARRNCRSWTWWWLGNWLQRHRLLIRVPEIVRGCSLLHQWWLLLSWHLACLWGPQLANCGNILMIILGWGHQWLWWRHWIATWSNWLLRQIHTLRWIWWSHVTLRHHIHTLYALANDGIHLGYCLNWNWMH